MKVCTKCKIEKELSEFHKRKSSKDGLRSWCKECRRQYNKENKEAIAEHKKQYCEKNKEAIAEKKKQYYEANKEVIAEKKKQYHKKNPHVALNGQIKRRKRIGNEEITKEEWFEVMNKYEWKCLYCGCDLTKYNRSMDHIIPISKGGRNIKENIAPACKHCNSSKKDKYLHEWLHPLHLREVLFKL